MPWNPHGAYPRQSTYTPFAGVQVQRAVNAPVFGEVGTGARHLPNLDSAYLSVARNAAAIAGGAAGSAAYMRGLAAREGGLTNGAVNAAHRRGTQARSAMQKGPLTRPTSPAAQEIFDRSAEVLASPITPISVEPAGGVPELIPGRKPQPWDVLLDPTAEPSFGRSRPSVNGPGEAPAAMPTPKVTSRARPVPRTVTNPFQQSLF